MSNNGRAHRGAFISGRQNSLHSTLYESDPSTYLDTLISAREIPNLSNSPLKKDFSTLNPMMHHTSFAE